MREREREKEAIVAARFIGLQRNGDNRFFCLKSFISRARGFDISVMGLQVGNGWKN